MMLIMLFFSFFGNKGTRYYTSLLLCCYSKIYSYITSMNISLYLVGACAQPLNCYTQLVDC